MSQSANFVLYRRDFFGNPKDADAAKNFTRQPLFSCGTDDKNAAVKIQAHMQAAYQSAIRGGNPLPDLDVIREEREANEAGQQTNADFVAVDPQSLEPARDAKPVHTLAEVI